VPPLLHPVIRAATAAAPQIAANHDREWPGFMSFLSGELVDLVNGEVGGPFDTETFGG
jgi:hypothetical protein